MQRLCRRGSRARSCSRGASEMRCLVKVHLPEQTANARGRPSIGNRNKDKRECLGNDGETRSRPFTNPPYSPSRCTLMSRSTSPPHRCAEMYLGPRAQLSKVSALVWPWCRISEVPGGVARLPQLAGSLVAAEGT